MPFSLPCHPVRLWTGPVFRAPPGHFSLGWSPTSEATTHQHPKPVENSWLVCPLKDFKKLPDRTFSIPHSVAINEPFCGALVIQMSPEITMSARMPMEVFNTVLPFLYTIWKLHIFHQFKIKIKSSSTRNVRPFIPIQQGYSNLALEHKSCPGSFIHGN